MRLPDLINQSVMHKVTGSNAAKLLLLAAMSGEYREACGKQANAPGRNLAKPQSMLHLWPANLNQSLMPTSTLQDLQL